MENNSIELALFEPEERELVEYVYSAIPAVDETEQLNYVLAAMKEDGRSITGVQIQLIQDAELQYGIEHGYYEEE